MTNAASNMNAATAKAQVFKAWMVRPSAVFATDPAGAPDGIALSKLSPESEVADSSDLLKRRMPALHINPNDLVHATGLCARCEARGKCMRDLDDEFADPAWGDWRNYCPNATTLSLLSTLHQCDLANRLNAATTYLVDLKRQFAGYGDHLEMVGEVLETLRRRRDGPAAP